jgi:7-cyano-7-deazaguanine synthase
MTRVTKKKTVALLSGGMDSATLIYTLIHDGWEVDTLSVDYGQRHVKELQAASAIAAFAGVRYTRVDLSILRPLISASALTGEAAVPHGHYAEESMRITVVPNRNMMMLAVAGAVAVSRGAQAIATAVHAGDHFIYPDCRPAFADAMRVALRCGTEGFGDIDLMTPFIGISKTDIARRGADLGVPFALTWSCYEGKEVHCGRCGTCVERREAFEQAGIVDPTLYAPVSV